MTIFREKSTQDRVPTSNAFCNMWKVQVNVDKSKIHIFSRDRICIRLSFIYDDKSIEIFNDFMYLGVVFFTTASLAKAKKHNAD